jgi:hypothetical protein
VVGASLKERAYRSGPDLRENTPPSGQGTLFVPKPLNALNLPLFE